MMIWSSLGEQRGFITRITLFNTRGKVVFEDTIAYEFNLLHLLNADIANEIKPILHLRKETYHPPSAQVLRLRGNNLTQRRFILQSK